MFQSLITVPLCNSVRLVNEFNNMPVPSKTKQQGKMLHSMFINIHYSVVSITDGGFLTVCTGVGEKTIKDIRPGAPFEPTYIYKLLTLIKSSLSEKVTILLLESHTLHVYCEAMLHDEFLVFNGTASGTDSA